MKRACVGSGIIHLIADNYATHKHPKIEKPLPPGSALPRVLHSDQQFMAEHVLQKEDRLAILGKLRSWAGSRCVLGFATLRRKSALDAWRAAHGRPLTDPEQYAAAKMRLFQGFDEVPKLQQEGRRLTIEGIAIEPLLEPLGLE